MARITLVRHGQASFGAQDYDCLSPTGEQQAVLTGAILPAGAQVVCGTMRRQLQTARGAFPGSDPQTDAGWNEVDFLDVIRALRPDLDSAKALIAEISAQPQPHRAFQALYSEAMARWASGQHDADYAETRSAFRARVRDALARLSAEGAAEVVVFTSGGPIAAAVQHCLDLPEDATRGIEAALANASLTRLAGRRGAPDRAPRLITFNAFTHLEAPNDLVTFR